MWMENVTLDLIKKDAFSITNPAKVRLEPFERQAISSHLNSP